MSIGASLNCGRDKNMDWSSLDVNQHSVDWISRSWQLLVRDAAHYPGTMVTMDWFE